MYDGGRVFAFCHDARGDVLNTPVDVPPVIDDTAIGIGDGHQLIGGIIAIPSGGGFSPMVVPGQAGMGLAEQIAVGVVGVVRGSRLILHGTKPPNAIRTTLCVIVSQRDIGIGAQNAGA